MPHGSVIGPMLFLLCIEDINHKSITSQIKLFAHDSVPYGNIRNQNDHIIHQNNLDTISSWTEKWLMELNTCINVLFSLLHSNVILVSLTIIYLAQRLSGLQTMII